MNQQMQVSEFFAMEAGEYLERLDALVSPARAPDFDELYRLARALRGSALMANQQPIATAALAFEHLTRAVKDGSRPWDDAIRQMAIRAVDDLKILVRRVGDWSDADDAKAAGLMVELDRLSGRTSSPQRAPVAPEALDAGTRAFIGREGAAVASSLDQAAKALQQNPLAHDPLQRVLKMMQPLRGLALLTEVPPMPDLLEGVERAIGAITRSTTPTDGAALLFHAAAKALSKAAQEVAGSGRADPDSPEAQEFAQRLGAVVALDEAVPIESLYHDDAGPHVVQPGSPTTPGVDLGRLELVSHGEHLLRAADELERATSGTQRQLRAQALAATFRALATAGGGVLPDAVAAFAHAARDAVTGGLAVEQTDTFAAHLRTAGQLLSGGERSDASAIAGQLAAITGALHAMKVMGGPSAAPAHGAPQRPRADSAAIASPGRQAPTARAPATAPAVPPRPAAPHRAAPARPTPPTPSPAGVADVIESWVHYERHLAERGPGKPSVEEFLREVRPGTPRTPASAAQAARPATAAEPAAVPITDLVYRGDAAAKRALSLRRDVEAALLDPAVNGALLRDLVEEIIDLVQLTLSEQR